MKSYFFILLLLTPPFSISANTSITPDNIHTLFTSASTRLKLDMLRNQGKFISNKNMDNTKTIHKLTNVKMQGIVIRNNMKNTIFINDKNTLKSLRINNHIMVLDEKVILNNYNVPININTRSISLMPGQQWNEADNAVKGDFKIKITEPKYVVNKSLTVPHKNTPVNTP